MKKSVVFVLHIGYWLLYLIVLLVLSIFLKNDYQLTSLAGFGIAKFMLAVAVIPAMMMFYLSYTFLFFEFLRKKHIFFLFAAGIAIVCISSLTGILIIPLLFGAKFEPGVPSIMKDVELNTDLAKIMLIPLNTGINGVIGLVMKGFITWYEEIKLKEDLNRKNYQMELALVKSQISPHFLFNTINNIDVLIEKDAGKASLYLNKLSDIMRFMLYETKTEEIWLTEELAYIEKYIDLQRIRTTNPDYVKFSVYGDPANITIAPMLFIPFIENAFKYAEHKKQENAIRIRVVIVKDRIGFDCENMFSENPENRPEPGGLGNELIQKRLALLYPGTHSLEITNQNNIYKVTLILYNYAH
jgi:two-component system LytT family sensor kinase